MIGLPILHSAGQGVSTGAMDDSPRRPFPVRHLMLLLALAVIATTATTALASAPLRESGVVLSISSEKHALRIVDGPKVVDASYRGTLPAGLSAGAQITFSTVAKRAFRFVVGGHVDHVLVSGTVVRAGTQLALRLSDGGWSSCRSTGTSSSARSRTSWCASRAALRVKARRRSRARAATRRSPLRSAARRLTARSTSPASSRRWTTPPAQSPSRRSAAERR